MTKDEKQLKENLETMLREYEQKLSKLKQEISVQLLDGLAGGAADRAHCRQVQENDPYLDEEVEIKLFKDGKDYRGNVYVSVNNQNCLIPRGTWFKIKRRFAMVLDQSEIQDQRTAELISRESSRFHSEMKGRD